MQRRFLVYALSCFAILCACSEQKGVVSLDPKSFEEAIHQNPHHLLIDVRTPEEFAGGHLPNAKLVDFKDPAFSSNISSLDKEKTVFVYCASGVRSAKAANVFVSKGFSKVIVMEEGFSKWQQEGRPSVE